MAIQKTYPLFVTSYIVSQGIF